MTNQSNHLIVFMRNPVAGKVKKRLSLRVGPDVALEIFRKLYKHTLATVDDLPYHKLLYFSEYIDEAISYPYKELKVSLQSGADLGERMKRAFEQSFENSAKRVVLIGTDCPEINTSVIAEAFEELGDHEVVIGPAEDGGYFLIGMSKPNYQIFDQKQWGGENVLIDTIKDLTFNNVSFIVLDMLYDVDTYEDAMRAKLIT